MKKIVAISILLTICIFMFTSCKLTFYKKSGKKSDEILKDYINISGTSGKLYFSSAKEGEDGYISKSMIKAVFGEKEVISDYSLLFSSRIDFIMEIGAFVSDSSSERMKITDICEDRIKLLSSLVSGKESFIKRYGNTVIYGFVESEEDAIAIFDKILT